MAATVGGSPAFAFPVVVARDFCLRVANLMSADAASRTVFSSSDRNCRRSVSTDSAVASSASCRSAVRTACRQARACVRTQSRTVFSARPTSFAMASHDAPRTRNSAARRKSSAEGGFAADMMADPPTCPGEDEI